MAEFPQLGNHCEWADCKQLDYLPIVCNMCQKTFCKDHSAYSNHSCASWNKGAHSSSSEPSALATYSCSLPGCAVSEMVESVCKRCGRNYCMGHRLEPDHQCPVKDELPMPKTAALVAEILERNQNASRNQNEKGAATKKLKPSSQRMAAKLQLMKIKMNAKGDEKGVPPEDRVYFKVHLPLEKSDKGLKEKNLFVSGSWSLGKALDSMAKMCQVDYKNKSGKRLRLFSHATGSLVNPQLSLTVNELIANGNLEDGSSLILEYADAGGEEVPALEPSVDVSKYIL